MSYNQYPSKDPSTNDTVPINFLENTDLYYDPDSNFFLESSQIKNNEEIMQDNYNMPEQTFINKKIDESEPKIQNLNHTVNEENKVKSNEITNGKQKVKRNNFIIHKTDYSNAGYQINVISHRSSNCKNRILRNLIQDIFIDWLSRSSNKKKFPKLKKLSKNLLEVIYKNYMDLKEFTLKEIYSGEYFKEILEQDRHIFEYNKKIIETYKNMDSKLNCTFKQAFNFFINKERIISSQNADILYGLKSKNEYINEKKGNEILEENIQKLIENINY